MGVVTAMVTGGYPLVGCLSRIEKEKEQNSTCLSVRIDIGRFNMPQKTPTLAERIKTALDADVPNIYFNASVHSLSATDILLVLEKDGKPVAVLNTSWTQAKSIVKSLNDLLQVLERNLGTPIKSAQEVSDILVKKTKSTQKRRRQVK